MKLSYLFILSIAFTLFSCSKEESTPTPTTISIPNNNFEKTFGGPQDDIANSIIIENQNFLEKCGNKRNNGFLTNLLPSHPFRNL